MAINYGANYTGIDKERYDAGNQFYSQDRFLQGIGLDKPAITFNPSRSNTGIMSNYNPYPVIPMYDGGSDGGGLPPGPRDLGVTADATGKGGYSKNPDGTAFNSPEIEEELAANRRAQTLRNVKNLGMFALNPMGFVIGKGLGYLKDKFFGGNDGGDGGGGGKGPTTDYYGPGGGYEGSDEQDRDNENTTDTMSSDEEMSQGGRGSRMAYGGRAGFGNGGLSKYEIFKLGELGYNTKGGTILEPFGGIKVLRDILRVNKYAYGGIVGMYR